MKKTVKRTEDNPGGIITKEAPLAYSNRKALAVERARGGGEGSVPGPLGRCTPGVSTRFRPVDPLMMLCYDATPVDWRSAPLGKEMGSEEPEEPATGAPDVLPALPRPPWGRGEYRFPSPDPRRAVTRRERSGALEPAGTCVRADGVRAGGGEKHVLPPCGGRGGPPRRDETPQFWGGVRAIPSLHQTEGPSCRERPRAQRAAGPRAPKEPPRTQPRPGGEGPSRAGTGPAPGSWLLACGPRPAACGPRRQRGPFPPTPTPSSPVRAGGALGRKAG